MMKYLLRFSAGSAWESNPPSLLFQHPVFLYFIQIYFPLFVAKLLFFDYLCCLFVAQLTQPLIWATKRRKHTTYSYNQLQVATKNNK